MIRLIQLLFSYVIIYSCLDIESLVYSLFLFRSISIMVIIRNITERAMKVVPIFNSITIMFDCSLKFRMSRAIIKTSSIFHLSKLKEYLDSLPEMILYSIRILLMAGRMKVNNNIIVPKKNSLSSKNILTESKILISS